MMEMMTCHILYSHSHVGLKDQGLLGDLFDCAAWRACFVIFDLDIRQAVRVQVFEEQTTDLDLKEENFVSHVIPPGD